MCVLSIHHTWFFSSARIRILQCRRSSCARDHVGCVCSVVCGPHARQLGPGIRDGRGRGCRLRLRRGRARPRSCGCRHSSDHVPLRSSRCSASCIRHIARRRLSALGSCLSSLRSCARHRSGRRRVVRAREFALRSAQRARRLPERECGIARSALQLLLRRRRRSGSVRWMQRNRRDGRDSNDCRLLCRRGRRRSGGAGGRVCRRRLRPVGVPFSPVLGGKVPRFRSQRQSSLLRRLHLGCRRAAVAGSTSGLAGVSGPLGAPRGRVGSALRSVARLFGHGAAFTRLCARLLRAQQRLHARLTRSRRGIRVPSGRRRLLLLQTQTCQSALSCEAARCALRA